MNIISLIAGAVLVLDCFIMYGGEGTMGTLSWAVFFVMLIWLLCIMFYAYPLQAQFYNTVKQTLLNAAILAMRKFPMTIVVFILNMLPVLLACIPTYGLMIVVRTSPIWILLAPGAVAFANAKMFVKLFDPYLKEAEEASKEEE